MNANDCTNTMAHFTYIRVGYGFGPRDQMRSVSRGYDHGQVTTDMLLGKHSFA